MKKFVVISTILLALFAMGCTAHINPATNMTFGQEVVLSEQCCRFWKIGDECWAAPDISEDAQRYIFFHYCDYRDGGGENTGSSDAGDSDSGDDGGDDGGESEGEGEGGETDGGRGDSVY